MLTFPRCCCSVKKLITFFKQTYYTLYRDRGAHEHDSDDVESLHHDDDNQGPLVIMSHEHGRYQSNCQRDLPRSNGHSQDPFTRRIVSLVSENQLLCPLSYLVNQMIQMWLYNDSYRLTCGPEMAERGICEGECQDQCQTMNEATPRLI